MFDYTAYYQSLRLAGLCASCQRAAVEERARCQRCLNRQAARRRVRWKTDPEYREHHYLRRKGLLHANV